jgi:hypothetical protein
MWVEMAIIEPYRRRENSVEEALIEEMYLTGISVRRVGDITEAPVGHAGFANERCSCRTSRFMERSRPGAIGRSRANILTLPGRHRARPIAATLRPCR